MYQGNAARRHATTDAAPADRRPATGRRSVVAGCALTVLIAVVGGAWITAPRIGDPEALVRQRVAALGGRSVALSDVSPLMRQAVVAAEDERFFRHHGVDAIGVARAAAYDAGHLSFAQGASTITEQLAKDLYLDGNDRSPLRKLQAAILAVQLEARLSKADILDAYLNSVYFGAGATGIAAASQRYFGVPPSALNLAQASLLAGVVESPSTDDPLVDPAAARARQGAVLREMVRARDVTLAEARRALDAPLALVSGRPLPPAPDISVMPTQSVSVLLLAFGTMLALAGAAGVLRRPAAVWRLASWSLIVAGVLVAARAVHGD
jgi:Transglycosylase